MFYPIKVILFQAIHFFYIKNKKNGFEFLILIILTNKKLLNYINFYIKLYIYINNKIYLILFNIYYKN